MSKDMANRTRKGNVTQAARKKSGIKGKFPVFDQKSAEAAIKLRNHGKGVSADAVLRKVADWARAHGNKNILAKVQKAGKSK